MQSTKHTPANPPTDTPPPSSAVSDAQRSEYLDAINAVRADTQDCGEEGVFDPAPPVSWNTRLDNAAWEHSNDMASTGVIQHDGSGTQTDETSRVKDLGRGSHTRERITYHGYTQWRAYGENIAAGQSDVPSVISDWLKSPQHCAILMNPEYQDMGMSLVKRDGTEYTYYWTLDFGSK